MRCKFQRTDPDTITCEVCHRSVPYVGSMKKVRRTCKPVTADDEAVSETMTAAITPAAVEPPKPKKKFVLLRDMTPEQKAQMKRQLMARSGCSSCGKKNGG